MCVAMSTKVEYAEQISKDKKNKCQSASAICGYKRACPSLGKMQTPYEQLAELPPVGSRIKLYEIEWCSREDRAKKHRKKKNKGMNIVIEKRSYLVPPPNCSTIDGKEKIFEVVQYTQGIDAPFLLNNHIVLRCVYPKRIFGEITTIPTRFVAVKNIRYVTVNKQTGDRKC